MTEYIVNVGEDGAAAQIIEKFGIEETTVYGYHFTGEEIVRCRDCEYYHDGTNNGRRYTEPHCLAIGELAYGALFDVDENDFCSWAKRKVDAQPQRLRGEGE